VQNYYLSHSTQHNPNKEKARITETAHKRKGEKIMQAIKNKTMASLIALLLMLSMTASLVLLPQTNAAITYHTSYVYVFVSPRLIGVAYPVASRSSTGYW
jgi:uncharacterized membrane protein